MELTPRILESQPRVVLGSLSLILGLLVLIAHPHTHVWELISGFLLGFAAAMFAVALVMYFKERTRK